VVAVAHSILRVKTILVVRIALTFGTTLRNRILPLLRTVNNLIRWIKASETHVFPSWVSSMMVRIEGYNKQTNADIY
jgi:hypothetical protein